LTTRLRTRPLEDNRDDWQSQGELDATYALPGVFKYEVDHSKTIEGSADKVKVSRTRAVRVHSDRASEGPRNRDAQSVSGIAPASVAIRVDIKHADGGKWGVRRRREASAGGESVAACNVAQSASMIVLPSLNARR